MNTEEKLTLALHRNCLILLGKLPLRQIVIKSLKWLLTEGLEVRILPGEPKLFASISYRVWVEHSALDRMVGDVKCKWVARKLLNGKSFPENVSKVN